MEAALAKLCADAEDVVRRRRRQHHHPHRPRGRAATSSPSPRCSPPAPCTSTWCAPGCARARAWWSRPGSRARCTTSRCLAGYGAEAIHPNLAFATLARLATCCRTKVDEKEVVQALHQGDRQGPAQGDVQDGHLHLPVVLRRADLRGGGPRRRRSSTSTSPARRSAVEGVGLEEVAEEAVRLHRLAYSRRAALPRRARRRRRLRLPHPRRGAHVDAGLHRQAPARRRARAATPPTRSTPGSSTSRASGC